jgi:hypothetical protein
VAKMFSVVQSRSSLCRHTGRGVTAKLTETSFRCFTYGVTEHGN